MLGGGDTTASALGSSHGGGGVWTESSDAAANNMVGSNGNNNNNNNSGEDEGERSFGGNRWPRQETLALLKIRSEMDVTFRDATVKGPLWEEVSRKLAELGYHRSAKKCKEKFENVNKYHRRTKDGRAGKSEGKTYKFFDQLEALQNNPSVQSSPPPPPQQLKPHPQPPMPAAKNPPTMPHVAVPSTTTTTIPSLPTNINLVAPSFPPSNPLNVASIHNMSTDSISNSTSSSTSSDLELEAGRSRKRKRKWKDFFERLINEVIQKQEDMQRKFLEAIEKREQERMVREEAWRMQEMTKLNRERQVLEQERSIAASKDAALMAFLQKLSDQQNPQINLLPSQPPLPPQEATPSAVAPVPAPAPTVSQQPVVVNLNVSRTDNGDQNYTPSSSSRWPKEEIEALIQIRTSLDAKYQENGPKGPLWEEISTAMKKLGYNRNAKRCKEKWENINKYFKKVKESNKKRPEDSKTCPYFHQLDVLYKEKSKYGSPSSQLKPENSVPLMVRPEQQWPPPPPTESNHQYQHNDHVMEDMESDQNRDDGDDEEEEEDEGGEYEIVASKPVIQ